MCRWVQGHGADRRTPAVWGQANYVIHGVVRLASGKGRCNATELHSLTIRVAPVLSLRQLWKAPKFELQRLNRLFLAQLVIRRAFAREAVKFRSERELLVWSS